VWPATREVGAAWKGVAETEEPEVGVGLRFEHPPRGGNAAKSDRR
jgi:hypothetical protein